MTIFDNIKLALGTVRDNWLRATLTMVIIAFGIMALVGILTAIDTAIYSLNDKLSYLGANSFDIDPLGDGPRGGGNGGRPQKQAPPFTYTQATAFKEDFKFPARVSLSLFCSGIAEVSHATRKTNPNVIIFGINENYLEARDFTIAHGRGFSARDAGEGGQICILGAELVDKLFEGKGHQAIGKTITLGSGSFRVVGVLESKGASMNQSEDRRILLPLQTAKRYYGADNTNYGIMVSVMDASKMDAAVGEATVTMRKVRGLAATDENDFEITKSDSLLGMIQDNTAMLRLSAVAIGFITLLGAAIGLMNIMLVSVTERTREIGVRKALGATSNNILLQFLTEAVVICQLGGLFGIVLGVLAGNVVSVLFESDFLIPWLWIFIALILTTVTGLLSGLYPALRAAALDPIESLRYE